MGEGNGVTAFVCIVFFSMSFLHLFTHTYYGDVMMEPMVVGKHYDRSYLVESQPPPPPPPPPPAQAFFGILFNSQQQEA